MAMQKPSIDPDTLDLLDFIGERPEDDTLWKLFSQQLAEADHLSEATFVRRDYDMIRRLLVGVWGDVACIRDEAKLHGPLAVKLIDALTPRLRRKQIQEVRRKVEPPPLPKCVKALVKQIGAK